MLYYNPQSTLPPLSPLGSLAIPYVVPPGNQYGEQLNCIASTWLQTPSVCRGRLLKRYSNGVTPSHLAVGSGFKIGMDVLLNNRKWVAVRRSLVWLHESLIGSFHTCPSCYIEGAVTRLIGGHHQNFICERSQRSQPIRGCPAHTPVFDHLVSTGVI
jgi:hypothetical protein